MHVSLHVDSLGGWIGLVALALILLQTLIFLSTNPRHRAGQHFAIFIVAAMLMVGGYAQYVNSTLPEGTKFWTVICYLGVALLPPALQGMVLTLIEPRRWQVRLWQGMWLMGIFWSLLLMLDNGHLITNEVRAEYRHPTMEKGAWFKPFFVVTYLQFTISYLSLMANRLRAPTMDFLLPATGFTLWILLGLHDFAVAARWLAPPALIWPGPVLLAVCLGIHLSFQTRRAQRAAAAHLMEYKTLFDNALEGIFRLHCNGTVLSINPALVKLLGYPSDAELIGQPMSVLIADPNALPDIMDQLRQQAKIQGREMDLRCHDGSATPVSLSMARIHHHEQGDAYEGIVFDMRDYKAKLHAEQQRESAQRLAQVRADFLASMSHEIRTPINAIAGYTELCLDNAEDEQQRDYLDKVASATNTLLGIINDILDLSKIEAGQLHLENVPVNPRQLVNDVIGMLNQRAQSKQLALLSVVDSGVPARVLGDPLRLQQIMINLCNNAIKFTQRGHVKLSLGTEPNEAGAMLLRIAVEDTGIGIAADKIPSLFDAYTQAEASTSRQFGGTGLGLNITRRLVEAMQGSITAVSEAGRGTTFICSLPLRVAEQGHDPNQTIGAKPNRQIQIPQLPGKRILVVDDVAFNCDIMVKLLEKTAATVHTARHGKEAIERLSVQDYDLILMDCEMPEMNGYEATGVIRAEFSATLPIVAMTANVLPDDQAKCLAAGMNDYLSKPYQRAEVYRVVAGWVKGA